MIPAAPVPGLEPAFEVAAALGPLEDHGVDPGRPPPGGADRRRPGHRPDRGGDPPRRGGLAGHQGRRHDRDRHPLLGADGRGEYVHFRTSGVRSGPPGTLDALLRGEPVDPSLYYFRVAVYLETSAPRLAALERSIFVASAIRGADSVRYTAYRVT